VQSRNKTRIDGTFFSPRRHRGVRAPSFRDGAKKGFAQRAQRAQREHKDLRKERSDNALGTLTFKLAWFERKRGFAQRTQRAQREHKDLRKERSDNALGTPWER